jgi:hypothetical protein
MAAGRELDALVAEKVMGEKVVETDECNGEDNLWLNRITDFGDQFELPPLLHRHSRRVEGC